MKIQLRFNGLTFFAWILLTGVLWYCPPAFSAVASYGVGGAPKVLTGNSRQLRLIEQEIRVSLPSRRVLVRSVFRNEGAATNITFGFLERGETGESGRFPKQGYFENFRVRMDNKQQRAVLFIPRNEFASGFSYDSDYSVYWALGVKFKKGQTRVLQHEFTSGQATMRLTDPQGGATRLFQFDLHSGSAWKGAIGKLKIVFDIAGLKDFEEIEINAGRGQKLQRAGDKWIWQGKNIKTTKDDILVASWWPGLRHFEVDGEAPSTLAAVVNNKAVQGDYDSVYPQKRDGKIWVPLRVLFDWLPAAPNGEENELTRAAIETYFSLDKGWRSVLTIVGSRELEASESGKVLGRYQMSGPAYLEKSAVMIELAPFVRALGGRIEAENGIVKIRWK